MPRRRRHSLGYFRGCDSRRARGRVLRLRALRWAQFFSLTDLSRDAADEHVWPQPWRQPGPLQYFFLQQVWPQPAEIQAALARSRPAAAIQHGPFRLGAFLRWDCRLGTHQPQRWGPTASRANLRLVVETTTAQEAIRWLSLLYFGLPSNLLHGHAQPFGAERRQQSVLGPTSAH